jgi:hypothetical protein
MSKDIFKIRGAVSGYDSTTGTQQNLSGIINVAPAPTDYFMDSDVQPSLIVGVNSDHKTNVLSAVTARTDYKNKDVGIGKYDIPIDTVIGYAQSGSTSNAVTLITIPAPKRYIITGIFISHTCNVTCDGTSVGLTLPLPLDQILFFIPKQPLTALNFSQMFTFPNGGIEVNTGTVTYTNVFTAGASNTYYIVFGHILNS